MNRSARRNNVSGVASRTHAVAIGSLESLESRGRMCQRAMPCLYSSEGPLCHLCIETEPRPVHVTLRVRPGIPSLRGGALVHEWRRSLAEASERGSFRVTHYSLQGDHAHLIVEAKGKQALASGMKSIAARLARAVNRVCQRNGPVLDGRYHHRMLGTPREVRRALAYVLLNARRHLAKRRSVARAATAHLGRCRVER